MNDYKLISIKLKKGPFYLIIYKNMVDFVKASLIELIMVSMLCVYLRVIQGNSLSLNDITVLLIVAIYFVFTIVYLAVSKKVVKVSALLTFTNNGLISIALIGASYIWFNINSISIYRYILTLYLMLFIVCFCIKLIFILAGNERSTRKLLNCNPEDKAKENKKRRDRFSSIFIIFYSIIILGNFKYEDKILGIFTLFYSLYVLYRSLEFLLIVASLRKVK